MRKRLDAEAYTNLRDGLNLRLVDGRCIGESNGKLSAHQGKRKTVATFRQLAPVEEAIRIRQSRIIDPNLQASSGDATYGAPSAIAETVRRVDVAGSTG